ncbi:MAG: hypothetical protein ACI4TR_03785 [Bacteroidaceae bacterium]
MKKIFNITLIALVAMIGFSSCSDDENEASILSGEWEGDWNMWYEDDYGSNKFEGVAGSKPYSADSLPKIVRRGGHQPKSVEP